MFCRTRVFGACGKFTAVPWVLLLAAGMVPLSAQSVGHGGGAAVMSDAEGGRGESIEHAAKASPQHGGHGDTERSHEGPEHGGSEAEVGHGEHSGHSRSGGHGGGHGGGHHAASAYETNLAHGHVVAVSTTVFIISSLMMMFFSANIVLLYLLNYRDPNIRSYVYKMLSGTVSIFIAVIFNGAVSSFWLEQVLPAPFPRGLNMHVGRRAELTVGVINFSSFFALTNGLAFWLKSELNCVYAVRVFGGHVAAFAGITLFGNVQLYFQQPFSVLLLAVLCLQAARFLSGALREKFLIDGPDGKEERAEYTEVPGSGEKSTCGCVLGGRFVPYPADVNKKIDKARSEKQDCVTVWVGRNEYIVDLKNMTQTRKDGQARERTIRFKEGKESASYPEWIEQVCEAEDDAAALVLSFLTLQTVVFWIDGEIPQLHGDESVHTRQEILRLSYAVAALLVALVTLVVLERILPHVASTATATTAMQKMKVRIRFSARFVNSLQLYLSMSLCWCLLTAVHWCILTTDAGGILATIISACVVSLLAIPSIIVLDWCSDRLLEQVGSLNATEDCISNEPSSWGTTLEDTTEKDLSMAFNKMFEVSTPERAMRRIISGLGLLVGIAWEKAFNAAQVAIIGYSGYTAKHPVITKVVFAIVVVSFAFPAWYKYIVPMARKVWKDHEERIWGETFNEAIIKLNHDDVEGADDLLRRVAPVEVLLNLVESDLMKLRMIQSSLHRVGQTESRRRER